MTLDPQDTLKRARSSLRELVLAQYKFFADHQSYATNLSQLMEVTGYQPAEGHTAELSGDGGGFTAMLRRTEGSALPDRATIWIGDHATHASRRSGVVYCE